MGTLSRSLSGRLILFIGAMVATMDIKTPETETVETFSPLFVGAMVATQRVLSPAATHGSESVTLSRPFSPLFIGDQMSD